MSEQPEPLSMSDTQYEPRDAESGAAHETFGDAARPESFSPAPPFRSV